MFIRAFAFAAFALSGSVFAADHPALTPAAEIQLSEFTPFGVANDSNLDALGCKLFKDELFECKGFPDKNSIFRNYTVETRSGPFGGICNVTAYTQVFRGDRTGYQVTKAYDNIVHLLVRKYGQPSDVVANNGADVIGFKTPDQFASAVAAGVKNFSTKWENVTGKLPAGTSVELTIVSVSDEKTFAELNYFFGGPGCLNAEDAALKGL